MMKLVYVGLIVLFVVVMLSTSDALHCNLECPFGSECLNFKCVPSPGRFKRGKNQWDQIPCQTDKDCPGSFCVGGFCYTGGK
uniref:Uncharacterized protein n=1 Tax=Panagrolaimus superbus TaxID=310955 RepID=A0A914ZA64_9BILA